MFGLSFGEILIVLVVALLVLGPERLPKVAKTIGKGMREFRRTTGDFRDVLEGELLLEDDPPRKRQQGPADGAPSPIPRATASLPAPAQGEDEAPAGQEPDDRGLAT